MPKPASSASQGNRPAKRGKPAEVIPISPKADEEHESLYLIDKWIKLADTVLENGAARKKA